MRSSLGRCRFAVAVCCGLAVSSLLVLAIPRPLVAGMPAGPAAESAQWIWSQAKAAEAADANPVLFRRGFEIAGQPEQVQMTITCDNRYELVVNNVRVGQGEDWMQPQQYRLDGFLRAGANTVIVRAKNDRDADPAGLAVEIEWTVQGQASRIVSDASWQWQPVGEDRDVWWVGAEGGEWKAAVALGEVGEAAPWGNRAAWDQPQVVTLRRVARVHQEQFEFVDGDRVTWIGGTWVERQQAYNYFETLVTSAYPDRDITFRNLGWSGDDVTGIARAVFGSQEDGFKRLRDDLLRTAPTVILVGYGSNEAFGGEGGLAEFRSGWERLVTLLDSTGAELVFVGPHYLENLGSPLPDPTAQNAEIDRYAEALASWCKERGDHFVDFREPLLDPKPTEAFRPDIRDRLTDNGLHFNAYGDWRSSLKLAKLLNVPLPQWEVELPLEHRHHLAKGVDLRNISLKGAQLRFEGIDKQLPYPAPPHTSPRGAEMLGLQSRLAVEDLPAGRWGLDIDGQPSIVADHDQWAEGVWIRRGAFLGQVEELRDAIAKKNDLYFHRYRPQNETYLFLFRKHEQGNNAVEVPQFDPLVEEMEKVIAQLKVPKRVVYTLTKIE